MGRKYLKLEETALSKFVLDGNLNGRVIKKVHKDDWPTGVVLEFEDGMFALIDIIYPDVNFYDSGMDEDKTVNVVSDKGDILSHGNFVQLGVLTKAQSRRLEKNRTDRDLGIMRNKERARYLELHERYGDKGE